MMDDTEKEIEDRKKKFKKKLNLWLKDKYALLLAGVIALAFIVRVYFLSIAKDQAHWWDTLAFGSIAREAILGYWTDNAFITYESIIRPPLLSLMWSWLLRFNFSDFSTLILLDILPSLLSVFFVYLLVRELYDKKTAIIASFILSVLWIHLFYSIRIMSDAPSLFFAVASMYFFVKSYEKIDIKLFALSIFLIALAILTRYFYAAIGVTYILWMIFFHRTSLIKNKNFWISGFLGSLPIVLFFVFNFINHGTLFPAFGVYTGSFATKPGFAFYTLSFIPYIFGKTFTLFIIIGFLFTVGSLILGFDRINKIKVLKSNLFVFIMAALPLAFFIFWVRASEDRYLFLAMPALLALGAIGISKIYSYIKNYSKYLAIIVIIGILVFGAYGQLTYAKSIIENKKSSYAQMKDAFLWIEENTPKDSVLLGDGIEPYAIYYGERRIVNWETNITKINESVIKADYVVLHGFEHQRPELIAYVTNRTIEFQPVQAFFFDPAGQQPAVIVYKINK